MLFAQFIFSNRTSVQVDLESYNVDYSRLNPQLKIVLFLPEHFNYWRNEMSLKFNINILTNTESAMFENCKLISCNFGTLNLYQNAYYYEMICTFDNRPRKVSQSKMNWKKYGF